jgi:nickel/cobalt exporter
MKRRLGSFAVAALLAAFAAVLGAAPVEAHPLGNFTVNRYTGLVVGPEAVHLDHVLDLAEIPTVQADVDRDDDSRLSAGELESYARTRCGHAAAAMRLRLDGEVLPTAVSTAVASSAPGQAGLPVLRVTCMLRAPLPGVSDGSVLEFADSAAADQIGWREATARGDGVTLLRSDVPAESVSRRLTAYPRDLLADLPDQRGATLLLQPGGARLPDSPRGSPSAGVLSAPAGLLGTLAGGELRLVVVALAFVVAVGTGAAHALAPGHGKTLMACYLASQRADRLRSAVTVGATITVTHTGGVLLLGLLLAGGTALAPERLYAWLTAASGLLVALVGAALLRSAVRERARPLVPASPHAHAHPHPHPHPHRHPAGPSRAGLAAMGVAGGLLPSPTAVVVLLGAVALGRAWLGVLLVLGFGLGMAATLTVAGLFVSRLRDRLDRAGLASNRLAWVHRQVPVALAIAVTGLGFTLATRAAL